MGNPNANSSETRSRILDTAESLFSDHGFRDVSLRQITSKAGVNIASVNYHFGSKDALVAEVLARVIDPINRERLRLLEEAETRAGGDPLPVEVILEAMHRPLFTQVEESSLNDSVYLKLAGRCLAEPAENFSEALYSIFREVITRFLVALKRSLSSIDEADLFWRMHFSVGTMIYALTHGDRVALFSEGRIRSPEPEEILQRLIRFTSAGLRDEAPGYVPDGPKKKAAKPRRGKTGAVLSLLAAPVLLTSCQSLSPDDAKHHASVDIPAHWVAGPSWRPTHYPDHHWVENFRVPELAAFVRSVIANNRDLKAAQSRIDVAAATARIVGADLYPQINGNFGAQRNLQNFIGFPLGGGGGAGGAAGAPPAVLSSRSNQFGLSLDLSWEIDLWGRIRAAKSATVAEFEASQFDLATAQLSLAGQAAKAWFALAEAEEQAELSRSTISVFSGTESLIRDRFEAGIEENGRNFASELLLAESDVARARDTLHTREELIGRTSRQLEVLAGKYPAGRAGRGAALPSLPGAVPTGLPATLLDRRPDLAAAERQVAAADERVLEARRSLLPAISLTGSYGTSSDDIGDLLDGTFSVWSIAGNALQPVFRGGELRANVSRREAELEVAAAEFEQAALTAFSEVENALAAERFLRGRAEALSDASRLTRAAYIRAREEFENGTGDILTVLSSQERAFTTKSQLITVRRLLLENRVDLYLALGGSFRPPLTATARKNPDTDS